jgi:plasmid stabilization system protein ParE
LTRVIWAPQAIQDVDAIRAHIPRDSAHYADLVVERLVAAVERLQDHPQSGRVVPELGDDSIREVIHGNYRSSTACDPISSRLRPSFMALALSGLTDSPIRASNFAVERACLARRSPRR